MIRWKAMSLLILSVALLLTACPGPTEEERAATAVEDEEGDGFESDSFELEDEDPPTDDDGDSGQSDATQDDDETAQPPVDNDGEDETSRCDLPANGPDPQVVPYSVVTTEDEFGNLNFNVQMCEPVDPLNPLGHLFSGFWVCGEWFGFEIHDEVPAVLGGPTEANTQMDGSFGFHTGPSGPLPLEVPCKYASWGSEGEQVISGQGVLVLPPPETGGTDDGNNPVTIVLDLLHPDGP